MSHRSQHNKIGYLEFTVTDVARAKSFYNTVFGWSFQDYGPDYASFDAETAAVDGGVAKGAPASSAGAPLIVLYSEDLKKTEADILAAGGKVVVPTFEFPGGRRFHFSDGVGNVLAVWSE